METVADEVASWEQTRDHLERRIKAAQADQFAIKEKAREIKNLTDSQPTLARLMVEMISVMDAETQYRNSQKAVIRNIKEYAGESSQLTMPEVTSEIRDAEIRELVGR